MKLYFGKINGSRYVLEIVRWQRRSNPTVAHEADIKVVDNCGDVIVSFNRDFDAMLTNPEIKRAMLDEATGGLES